MRLRYIRAFSEFDEENFKATFKPDPNSTLTEEEQYQNAMAAKKQEHQDLVSLRLEAIQKLNQLKPLSIGQASRISGVSPADITVLLVWLEQHKEERNAAGI